MDWLKEYDRRTMETGNNLRAEDQEGVSHSEVASSSNYNSVDDVYD